MANPAAPSGDKVEKARVSRIANGYARGGTVKVPAAAKKADIKKPSGIARAIGAMEGEPSKPRLDRYARGGAVKKGAKTNVNVIVAPQQAAPAPVAPVPVPVPPPSAPPMAARPPMLQPGAPIAPPGAMPPGVGPKPFKRGGAVKAPKMTAGAESGEGRLQKAAIQRRRGV